MKRFATLALTLAMLLTLATGCGGKAADSGSTPSGEAGVTSIGDANDVYYMISYLSTLEFWDDAIRGFEDAAAIYGAQTKYTGAPGVDAAAQITVLEQVMATNPAGIAITCCDATALEDTINKAIAQGIEVVCFDADSAGSNRYSILQTGNETAGEMLADTTAMALGEKGEVAICFSVGSPTHEARAAGIRNGIAKYSGMKVVAESNYDGEQTDAASVAAALIQGNPNLDAIFVTNANGALGAAAAVREAGKTDTIKVIGFDTDGGMFEAIDNGEIFCTAKQGAYNMGFWSMQFLFCVKNDLVNPVDGWREKGLNPLPVSVDTGVTIVDKDNLAAYYSK